MVARQLVPPNVPMDRFDPLAQDAVLSIRAKLGTKECFPDLDPIVSGAVQRADEVKDPENKRKVLMEALNDLKYVRDSSKITLRFLEALEGIEDPEPYYDYFEACELTLTYLTQLLEYPSFPAPASIVTATALPLASEEHSPPVLPLKPTMTTKEVAPYIGKKVWTVRHYISDGKIPCHRTSENSFPYFIRTEIDAWLAAGLCPSRRNRKPKAKSGPAASPTVLASPLEEPRGEVLSSGIPHLDSAANRHAVIVQLASLLAQTGHIDEVGKVRLVKWIESGCNELPATEFIDWRSGRKTLCSFIVCGYRASLLPLKISTKKSGKPGPMYEKPIISAFLDDGKKIKAGIDRTIAGPHEAMERFSSIMNTSIQADVGDAREEDTFFDNISCYYARRKSPSFETYREQIDDVFELSGKKTKIFTEIEEGVLKLFLKLYADYTEPSA